MVSSNTSLSDVERELFTMSDSIRQYWYVLGSMLLEVEKNQLYKQSQHRSYSAWHNSISISLDLKPSTLWKYLKIVRMTNELAIPEEQINLKNVTGLEQIARIYKSTKDSEQALELIESLNNKSINISEIKRLANSITSPVENFNNKNFSSEETKDSENLASMQISIIGCSLLFIVALAIYLIKSM